VGVGVGVEGGGNRKFESLASGSASDKTVVQRLQVVPETHAQTDWG
jgi:hypothetical protein